MPSPDRPSPDRPPPDRRSPDRPQDRPSPEPWEQLGPDEIVYDGWLKIARRRYRTATGAVIDWDVHVEAASVAVLAITPDGLVVLVEEFRPGPSRVVRNLPGGLVDRGEPVADAAARELREETGYAAGSLEVVGSFSAFSSSAWVKHVAIARDCVQVGEPDPDEHEDLRTVLVTVEELRADLRAGTVVGTDNTYFALDHAGLL